MAREPYSADPPCRHGLYVDCIECVYDELEDWLRNLELRDLVSPPAYHLAMSLRGVFADALRRKEER
jgi:hypothetical protein